MVLHLGELVGDVPADASEFYSVGEDGVEEGDRVADGFGGGVLVH